MVTLHKKNRLSQVVNIQEVVPDSERQMISPRNPKWANAPRAPAPRGEENLSDDTNPGIITPTRDIENSRPDRTNQSDFEPQNNPSV